MEHPLTEHLQPAQWPVCCSPPPQDARLGIDSIALLTLNILSIIGLMALPQ